MSGGKISATKSAAIGKSDKGIVIKTREDYIRQLKWISGKFVLLFDIEDKRAWLVGFTAPSPRLHQEVTRRWGIWNALPSSLFKRICSTSGWEACCCLYLSYPTKKRWTKSYLRTQSSSEKRSLSIPCECQSRSSQQKEPLSFFVTRFNNSFVS